jgi:hypothetical protein
VRCSFLVNARSSTITADFYERSAAGGFLFPPDRPTRALTRFLSTSRVLVLSDNGAFDTIGRLAKNAPLATGTDRWAAVVRDIRAAARLVDPIAQLPTQLSVKPNAIIGIEDITLATWLRSGVDEGKLRALRAEIRRRNVGVAARGVALQQQLTPVQVLTVASAHDYDTAQDAGVAMANAGVRAAAVGFGAFMADDGWTSTAKVHGRVRKLGRLLPSRYLRTALVARGFFDGWATTGQSPPDRFHFLGLGAPIMLPLAALAASACREVSFDATSPIRDATEATLYVSRPASLKVRTWKVADAMSQPKGTRWSCPCSFCRTFTSQHPFDLAALRQLRAAGGPGLSAADLRTGGRLADIAPLFRIGGGALGRSAEAARIGHNHWVLGTMARRLTTASHDLEPWVARHVADYRANAGADHFAEAVRLAFEITRPAGDFWS